MVDFALSVIVVNYNSSDVLGNCLLSVFEQESVSAQIIVVDNASGDNFSAAIAPYADKISVIQNSENLGFAKACNKAAKIAAHDHLFFLNPDAQFTDTQNLFELISFYRNNSNIGILSAGIEGDLNHSETCKTLYPGEKFIGKAFLNLPGKIAWVIGAGILISKNLFDQLNGFDESFFLYAEDADLCLRVRKQGYEIAIHPSTKITHIGGHSEKDESALKKITKKQNAYLNFYKKYYDMGSTKKIIKDQLRKLNLQLFIQHIIALFSRKKTQKKIHTLITKRNLLTSFENKL